MNALTCTFESLDFILWAAENHCGDSVGEQSGQSPMLDYMEDGCKRDKTSWHRVSFTY